MKKNTIFAAVLAGTLAISLQLCSSEVAAATPAAPAASNTTMSAGASSSNQPMSAEASSLMVARLIGAFKNSLKTNRAAGAVSVRSLAGNTLASYADIDKTFSPDSVAAAELDKRVALAASKALTSGYMGSDSAKVSDGDLAKQNAAFGGTTFTNMAGGTILVDANGRPLCVIGVSAVGIKGQDMSAQVAADVAKELSGNTAPLERK